MLIYRVSPFFKFADDVNKPMSTKDDAYWESAEKQRLLRLDRAKRLREEKVRSRDPDTIAKIRRKIANEEYLGKVMQDPPRLAEAKALRKMIGDAEQG